MSSEKLSVQDLFKMGVFNLPFKPTTRYNSESYLWSGSY